MNSVARLSITAMTTDLLYAFTVIAGKVGERLCILEREMHKLMHKLMNNLRVWRSALSLSAPCREL